MPLVLHKVLKNGSVCHEPFTHSAWDRALRDDTVARRWGHIPSDCHDPVTRHREQQGAYNTNERQEAISNEVTTIEVGASRRPTGETNRKEVKLQSFKAAPKAPTNPPRKRLFGM